MPGATRVGDATSPPGAHTGGSPDTFVNNIEITRLGDPAQSLCSFGTNCEASEQTFVNNIGVHRRGDAICFVLCTGSSAAASPDTFIDSSTY